MPEVTVGVSEAAVLERPDPPPKAENIEEPEVIEAENTEKPEGPTAEELAELEKLIDQTTNPEDPKEKKDSKNSGTPEDEIEKPEIKIKREIPKKKVEEAIDLAGKQLIAKLTNEAGNFAGSLKGKTKEEIEKIEEIKPGTAKNFLAAIHAIQNNPEGIHSLVFSGKPLEIVRPGEKTMYVIRINRINSNGSIDCERYDDVLSPSIIKSREIKDVDSVTNTKNETGVDPKLITDAILTSEAGYKAIYESLSEAEKRVFETYIKGPESEAKLKILKEQTEKEEDPEKKKELDTEIEELGKIDESPEMIEAVEIVLRDQGITTAGRLLAAGIKNPELIKDMIIIEDPQILIEIFGATPENQLVLSEMNSKLAEIKRKEARENINTTLKEQALKDAEVLDAAAHAHDLAAEELKKPDNKIGQKLKSAFGGSNPTLSESIITILEHNIKDGTNIAMDEIISELFPKEAEKIKGFLGKYGPKAGKIGLLAALGLMYALMKSGKEQPQY